MHTVVICNNSKCKEVIYQRDIGIFFYKNNIVVLANCPECLQETRREYEIKKD